MRVAVVGSGVSGLAATWLLNDRSKHEVHLYESDSRPGGHANTVTVTVPGKKPVDVDSGFIVFNPSTYPNFLRFLRSHPSIEIIPTEMTFGVSRDGGAFEWAGKTLFTVFCQPKRLVDPDMWRLLYDVLRFNACARRLLTEEEDKKQTTELSIEDYLRREGYSNSFRDNYLVPMTAAVWSTPPDVCALDFPAKTLIRFLHNHHLLQLTGKPSWLTIRGGSKRYVNTILSSLPEGTLHLSSPVASVSSTPRTDSDGFDITLTTLDGATENYDHVIFACHSDDALKIMSAGGGVTHDEERILGGFRWNRNEVIVHSDEILMPRSKAAWSCWNYLTKSGVDAEGYHKANNDQVALFENQNMYFETFIDKSSLETDGVLFLDWMNDLQKISLETHGPIFATLNPPVPPSPSKTFSTHQYSHPVLDARAVRLQSEMPSIQGKRCISYAGAWMKYGFHEDGFASGLRAAEPLLRQGGENAEFEVEDAEREGAREVSLIAAFFDWLESSGARVNIATILGLWLGVVRTLASFYFDLSDVGTRPQERERKDKFI